MLFGGRLAVSPLSILGISGGQGKHIERTLSCIRNAPRCGRFGSDRSADGTQLKALLAPYPAEEMICWPVSPRVGNVKNNYPNVIERIAGAG